MIKYIKSVLWREAKRLSYIEDARCLKVKKGTVGTTLETVTNATRLLNFAIEMLRKERLFKCDRGDVFQGHTNLRKLPTQGLSEFPVFVFIYRDRDRYILDSFIFSILCQNTAAETKLTITAANQHSSLLPTKQIKNTGIQSCGALLSGETLGCVQ